MDYSDRVNSKKGSGGVADASQTNIHTKRRIKELLTSQVLDLDNDPYVSRSHLGLECRLCLTVHANESSYISHLGGRKHALNLERRRIMDDRYNRQGGSTTSNVVSINSGDKRTWNKIGRPAYKVTKIRDTGTLQMGMLVQVQFPRIGVAEPFFRFMSYFELSSKNQNVSKSFLHRVKLDYEDEDDIDPSKWLYLVISGEPYENIAIAIPALKEINKPDTEEMSRSYWWFWDEDSREFFLQVLFKNKKDIKSKAAH